MIVARKDNTTTFAVMMGLLWANASGVATEVWECRASRVVLKVCHRMITIMR